MTRSTWIATSSQRLARSLAVCGAGTPCPSRSASAASSRSCARSSQRSPGGSTGGESA